MNYKYILFDLDGTLIDSKAGILSAAIFALDKMGVPATQIVNLERMIGPPLKYSLKEFFSLSDEFADKAVEYYREYYRDKSLFDCEVYEGIAQLLEMLKNDGYILAIATSKPTVYAKKILEHTGLAKYFDAIEGASLDDSHSNKSQIITRVCEVLNIYNPSQAIMIGDRSYDIKGASSIDMESIGVLYGYGSLEEFQEAGASYVVNSVKELGQFLYSLKSDEVV